MPVTDTGIGYSSNTPKKQEQLERWLRLHMQIAMSAMNRARAWKNPPDPYYYLFDINAGSGIHDGGDGSPIIALRTAAQVGIMVRMVFIEKDPDNYDDLRAAIGERPNVRLHWGDHEELLPQYFVPGLPCFGLLYTDPTGSVPPFGLLRSMSVYERFQRLDFMAYLSATNLKRVRRSMGGLCLIDHLQSINKKYWIIREPEDKHQWTFILGTNWKEFPDWKREGFHRIESRIGRAILDYLSYTSEERASQYGHQVALF